MSPLRAVPRLLRATAALALPAVVAPVATQAAAVVSAPVQPLAMVGAVERPPCPSTLPPFRPAELFARVPSYVGLYANWGSSGARGVELTAAASDADLQPSVVLCSPTFAGLPGPIGGTTAATLSRSRVGLGWRELGSPITSPAALVPGDRLTIPPVDDAAQLRLSLALNPKSPTTPATLTDLAPGPSTVEIGRDARGLTARLVRADGTTTETAVAPTAAPRGRTRFTGTRRRWTIRTPQLPGTTMHVEARSTTVFSTIARSGANSSTLTAKLKVRYSAKSRRRVRVITVAVNRAAHWVEVSRCVAKLDRQRRPDALSCKRVPMAELVRLVSSEFITGARASTDTADLLSAVNRALTPPERVEAKATAARVDHARRSASAHRLQATSAAGIAFRPIGRSADVERLAPYALRPLAADVNGDGQPDFWTEQANQAGWEPADKMLSGVLLTSSPGGLTAHLVDRPGASTLAREFAGSSEISAIADITGDGIGELVVDLGERFAIVPGSTSWTGTTTPISATDPGPANPQGIVIKPDLSSPGAPISTVDDVTGDGLPELVLADDDAGWISVASESVRRGSVTPVPSAAGAVRPPATLPRGYDFDRSGVPQTDTAFRAIAGHALSLQWPVVTSKARPTTGRVVVAIRDALGRDVRPPVTIPTPGDARLLDYDRPTGALLLMAQDFRCRYARCARTVMRVAADGRVTQTMAEIDRNGAKDPVLGSARFGPDGPDADADPEVVFARTAWAVAVADSTRTGALAPAALPAVRIVAAKGGEEPWTELRMVPWFGAPAGGGRRLLLALPQAVRYESFGSGWDWQGRVFPGELAWP